LQFLVEHADNEQERAKKKQNGQRQKLAFPYLNLDQRSFTRGAYLLPALPLWGCGKAAPIDGFVEGSVVMAPESDLRSFMPVTLRMGYPSIGSESFKEFQNVTWINLLIGGPSTPSTCRVCG
jgi:hypothetical protein